MKKQTVPASPKKGGKKKIWIPCLAGGIVLSLAIAFVCTVFVPMYQWIHPEKVPFEELPSDHGLDYYGFEVETVNGTVYGWKMAAQQPMDADAEEWVYATEYSDKTVILASNYDSNREISDLGGIDYMADLCAAGYNVITFDWTGSGYSDGTKNVFTLDKTEELKAVVAFAAEETGASFIAVQGIGFGCYPAAVAAAECEQVDALILDSCYASFEDAFYGNFELWSGVPIEPVKASVQCLFPLVSGVDLPSASLADPMNALSGKSVLFIQGENDEVFGTQGASRLYELAKADNTASLWLVPEVGQLRARSYDGETYLEKVNEFLTKSVKAEEKA